MYRRVRLTPRTPRTARPFGGSCQGWRSRFTLRRSKDYTHVHPHGSIDGLIPWERYLEPERKPDNSAQRRMAQALRIVANRMGGCDACE